MGWYPAAAKGRVLQAVAGRAQRCGAAPWAAACHPPGCSRSTAGLRKPLAIIPRAAQVPGVTHPGRNPDSAVTQVAPGGPRRFATPSLTAASPRWHLHSAQASTPPAGQGSAEAGAPGERQTPSKAAPRHHDPPGQVCTAVGTGLPVAHTRGAGGSEKPLPRAISASTGSLHPPAP